MTKNELASRLSDETGFSRIDALRAVEGMMRVMSDTFAEGHNIYLRGFGTFRVISRKPRPGHNFKTGEVLQLPAKKVVKFKPCETLKEMLNNA